MRISTKNDFVDILMYKYIWPETTAKRAIRPMVAVSCKMSPMKQDEASLTDL